jgi:hypothetical protein
MSHPPRIARDVPLGQRKPNLRRKRSHLAFIRQLRCVACGLAFFSEATHVRCGTDGGTAIKSSDKYAVPLCRSHWSPDGLIIEGCHAMQHRIGELSFWSALRIDPLNIAHALWKNSGDIEAGERIVFRARQAIGLRK